jgi:hypothetical protein
VTTGETATLIGVMDPGEPAGPSAGAATNTDIDEEALADVAGHALDISTVTNAGPAFVDDPGTDQPVGSGPVEAVQQAARMLRSIAPWTAPSAGATEVPSAEPSAEPVADPTPDED